MAMKTRTHPDPPLNGTTGRERAIGTEMSQGANDQLIQRRRFWLMHIIVSTLVPTDQFAGLDAQSLREALRPKSQSGVDQFARQLTLPFFVCRKAYGDDA